MPNVTLHLLLADAVLDEWEERGSSAPFDLHDPVALNAFYHGAFGPDLGYFPGGHPFLSDLAHTVRTGELMRNLVGLASTDRERAFAWGWVTHVLGDVAIHPLVGLGVGELVHEDAGRFVSAASDKTSHVRVEVGLDAHYSALNPHLKRRILGPAFDQRSVAYLASAYRETYGFEVDPQLALATHLSTLRMSLQALTSIGVMGQLLSIQGSTGSPVSAVGSARWLLHRALSVVHYGFQIESMLLAYLNPVRASRWLVDRVDEVIQGFPRAFFELFEGGLERYPDYNLDTGRVESVPEHPVTRASLETLNRIGSPLAAPASALDPVRYRGHPARVG
jgi:hypothetical protein